MDKHGINVLSCFDGMSCGQLALEQAGIQVATYFASEVDKHAMKVTQRNYPNTRQVGDITRIKGSDFPAIDLLIGGSPCQGFSFAGKQLNFNDPRSRLFFEFVRLLEETKPTYFLLENVLMKKEYEQVITDCLGVEPVLINSALVSAQNRRRLYWTNIPNVTQPQDKGITWGDVRERGVNQENYYYSTKAMQWLAKMSRERNKTLTVHADHDKMQMLEASHCKKYSLQRFFGIPDLPESKQLADKMRAGLSADQPIEFQRDGNTLVTVEKEGATMPFADGLPSGEFFFRYITPLECERLQGVPDNFTSCVSDTQRYKMLGNGWTVGIIAHILSQL